jgi:hypothetical protein
VENRREKRHYSNIDIELDVFLDAAKKQIPNGI